MCLLPLGYGSIYASLKTTLWLADLIPQLLVGKTKMSTFNSDMTIANRIFCTYSIIYNAGGAGRSRTYYCTRRCLTVCLQPHISVIFMQQAKSQTRCGQ